MGFSGIVSQIMLVFTMMGIITLVIITYKGYVSDTNAAIQIQEEQIQEKINTNLLITNATYVDPQIYVTVKNTGSIALALTDIDVYVDNVRIPRAEENRTFTLQQNIINQQQFDPAEKLFINISRSLDSGYHRVEIVALQGVRSAEILEI